MFASRHHLPPPIPFQYAINLAAAYPMSCRLFILGFDFGYFYDLSRLGLLLERLQQGRLLFCAHIPMVPSIVVPGYRLNPAFSVFCRQLADIRLMESRRCRHFLCALFPLLEVPALAAVFPPAYPCSFSAPLLFFPGLICYIYTFFSPCFSISLLSLLLKCFIRD